MADIVTAGFDYSVIDTDARDDVRDAAVRIKVRMARTASDIIDIGTDLIAVKAALGHGHFLTWIGEEFGMTERSARRFMAVSERLSVKSDRVSDLGATALYALAAPSTPDEIRDDVVDRTAAGETSVMQPLVSQHEHHLASDLVHSEGGVGVTGLEALVDPALSDRRGLTAIGSDQGTCGGVHGGVGGMLGHATSCWLGASAPCSAGPRHGRQLPDRQINHRANHTPRRPTDAVMRRTAGVSAHVRQAVTRPSISNRSRR